MLGKQGYFFGLSHLLAAFDTMCQRLIEHVLKILLQDIHIIADLGVGDSGIELGDLDIGVTKHLRYWFDRHTVFEGDGGRKSVAGRVEGDILVDHADSGHLLLIPDNTRSLFGGIIQSANMHEPFDDVIRSLCSCAKSPSNATVSASSSPAARTQPTCMTSTQNSTTISKHFKIITKEVGRDKPIETEFVGDVDRA